MKNRLIFVLAVFFILSSFVLVSTAIAGRIVVVNDDWILSDEGFLNSVDTGTFALNVADWFTGGQPGKFLVYSNHFGLTDSNITQTMISAGHTWNIDTSISFNVNNLLEYDGVFTGDINVDNQVLTDYVNAGGNVYVFSAGNPWDPGLWNNFLASFGLQFGEQLSYVGNIPISSSHEIFAGVDYLYTVNGSYIVDTAPSDDRNEILVSFNGGGVYAVYDSSADAQNNGFTQADLAGTWYLETFGDDTAVNGPLWGHVKITVDAAGAITSGTVVNSAGNTIILTGGTLTLDNNGIITGIIAQGGGFTHTIPYGKLDARKTFFSTVKSFQNFRSLVVGVKGGGHFKQADLAGMWYLETLNDYTSTNAPMWGHVIIEVDATGAVTSGIVVNSDGNKGNFTGGSLIMDSDGLISGTFPYGAGLNYIIPYGKMDAGKTTLTMVKSFSDYQGIVIGVKKGSDFTQKDLSGKWHVAAFVDNISVNSPQWAYGTMTINGTGKITGGSFYNSLGLSDFAASGNMSIDSFGVVSGTMTEGDGYIHNFAYGKLDAGKTILTLVESIQNTIDCRGLVIMIKDQEVASHRGKALPWLPLLLMDN